MMFLILGKRLMVSYMAKVSIVLATYNGGKYIEKQLETIRRQSRIPEEVIIVDDCSTDGTVDCIQHYIERFGLNDWKLFLNEKNIGYKKNFYKGLKKATGDYIFLSDQDDEWCENKIERMTRVMEENSNLLALSCAVQIITGDSRRISTICEKNYYNSNFLYLDHKPQNLELFDITYIAKHNISPGCTTVVRHQLLDGFFKLYNFELPHDWFLNMLAASKSGCGYLDEKLIRYRVHGDNAIGANTGVINGIKKKTRQVRIEDYEARNRALDKIVLNKDQTVERIINLNNDMIAFYRNPSVVKLIKLRTKPAYYELAKRKVRIWECFVALQLDELLVKIMK